VCFIFLAFGWPAIPLVTLGQSLKRYGYVLLFALAKQQGGIPGKVKQELDAAGIRPALDPEKVGATFYRRADLTGKLKP
jgi:hypothetical protein